jgi:hypothetical protein
VELEGHDGACREQSWVQPEPGPEVPASPTSHRPFPHSMEEGSRGGKAGWMGVGVGGGWGEGRGR